MPAFEAALESGADAVYLGAPAFNARALARDFSFPEIAAMTAWAHERGKKVHLAMNSLVKEQELRQAVATLERLAAMQVDGLIVQDLGLVRLARQHFPSLPLHASTLMTAHNADCVTWLAGLGCRRVVLARELSLAEIDQIAVRARQLGVELEVFVHGAMCFSYSGLCRFSSLHGGKSSLRGQCVQPCRRPYQWLVSGQGSKSGKSGHRQGKSSRPEGAYFFSMNDLCALEHLGALGKTGVSSLKIEGRLKSASYVRHAVRAYRLALDAGKEADSKKQAEMLNEARSCLDAAMGRRRSSGFLLAKAEGGPNLISPDQSGNSGMLAGRLQGLRTVRRRDQTLVQAQVLLRIPLKAGDRLRLHEENSDLRVAFTLRDFQVKGRPRQEARAGESVEIRVNDATLAALKPPFHGKLYRVDVSGRQERISPQLARLRDSMAAAEDQAQSAALERAASLVRTPEAASPAQSGKTPGRVRWWVQVGSFEALNTRFPFAVSRWVLELNESNLEQALSGRARRWLQNPHAPRLTWCLPPIILEARLPAYRDMLARLVNAGFSSFQLGNPAQKLLFAQPEKLDLFGDASFNLLNHQALLAVAEQGFAGAQFSLESDRATFRATLLAAGKSRVQAKIGLLAYGRPALFTARAQSPHFKGHYALQSRRGERYVLKTREDGVSLFAREPFSLLEYGKELLASGVDYLVADISQGTPKREAQLLAAFWTGKAGDLPHLNGNYDGELV